MPLTPDLVTEAADRHDDFGFEMRVGRVLRAVHGAKVRHGENYDDPVTGLSRQSDYRFQFGIGGRFIHLAVECKNFSDQAPAVISSVRRRVLEANHDTIRCECVYFHHLKAYSNSRSSSLHKVRHCSKLYPGGGFVGKNAARYCYVPETFKGKGDSRELIPHTVKIEGDSDLHTGFSQALASAHGLCHEATILADQNTSPILTSLILPVLVVPNECLWLIRYDDDGLRIGAPEKVTQCTFFVGRKFAIRAAHEPNLTHDFEFSHVHLLTLSGLDQFLRQIENRTNDGDDFWVDYFPPVEQ